MHSALPQAMVICYANHAERINPFPTRQNDKFQFIIQSIDDIVGAIINRPLSIRTVEVLQSAANLQITMIAGGNHTDIQYAGPYRAPSLRTSDRCHWCGNP